MIITIKGETVDIFKDSNIGTLSTYNISTVLGKAEYNGPDSVDKNTALNATVTIAEGYEVGTAGVTVIMGGNAVTSGISQSGNVITISIASVTGNVVIKVPTKNITTGEEEEPETPANPPSGDGTISVTWEQGAIDSGKGPNSTAPMPNRARTQGYIQVNSSIIISCSGNAEFCPIYYQADKTYISSPNAYQTDTLTVDGSSYPLVRIMIRDKTDTSATMSATFGENYMTITGDGVEIPYGSGDESETPTRNIPPLSDTITWYVGALNSSNGEIVSMGTRLYSNRFALTSSPMAVTVSGNAEICPVWYNADGSFKSSPAAYQTTTITTTSADGHSVSFMIRDKSNANATLTTDFGSNVTIS